jgi:PhoH-like ATPase
LPAGFWEEHGKSMDSWQEEGHTYYRIKGPLVQGWMPSLFLHDAQEDTDYIVRKIEGEEALIERAHNYRTDNHSVWGVTARNQEQNYALNLLLDPEIDFVTMLGPAGTGKTLLTLAAALHLTLDKQAFREIIITRVTVPIGEDIGFLPGSEEEKMEPWMGAVMDNLEALTANSEGGEWERAATSDLIGQRVKIRSMNFMRGRTFYNRFLIIDEAQNLTPKQMKTLVTRAGPGTKVVCIGNIAQIDTPYLTETSSGLTYVVDRMKAWEHSGHVTLRQGERSRLSDYAIGVL